MKNETELKKYLNGFGGSLRLSITIIIVGIISFSMFSSDKSETFMLIAAVVCILIGAYLSYSAFKRKKTFDNTFKELNSTGLIKSVIDDFNAAEKVSSDKGRLGDKYLYIKHSDTLFSYDKIVQVYEYVHRTNFIIDERAVTIHYVNSNGKILKENIPVAKPIKNKEEPRKIMLFLLTKNPNIKVGY